MDYVRKLYAINVILKSTAQFWIKPALEYRAFGIRVESRRESVSSLDDGSTRPQNPRSELSRGMRFSASLFQITETYAFLPREAVTRFLLGCTECQRRPRTPSPTNHSSQPQSTAPTTTLTSTLTSTSTVTPLSSVTTTAGNTTALAASSTTSSSSSVQSSPKVRDNNHHAAPSSSEGKNLHSYRHQKQQKNNNSVAIEKVEKDKEEKYNPLSITNLLKKEPVNGGFLPSAEALPDSRRTPESDRASSKSSASSKRKRMLPEGRTPSPQPSQPLPRPWSPGLDTKNTPIDYSRPITTSYLKHQQRMHQQAEKSKAAAAATAAAMASAAMLNPIETDPRFAAVATPLVVDEMENVERERFSPATGLIDTNLNLLATIQHLHCQVMLALTERLRPSAIAVPSPLVLPPTPTSVLTGAPMMIGTEVSVQTGENHS